MKYLEHITAALKAAGLIKAVRGTRGGYALARPPADVNLGEVFRVLEGAPLVVECVENPRVCPRNSFCPTRDTWVEMRDAIQGVLDGTTLASLAERAREKASEPCVSYEI
jgi:Rrf2 family protein